MSDPADIFREFVAIVKALRTPGTGCPWDLEQDHQSLRPYLIEETYEVLDALDRADDPALRDELGDLLLQIVLHAQIADERGAFDIAAVIRGIADKMIRRHPHVFGSVQVSGAAEVVRNWEQIKAAERADNSTDPAARLDRLPLGLPALQRAQRLGEKAGVAPDPESLEGALAALANGMTTESVGAALFALAQAARVAGVDAEQSLRDANRRFIDKFRGAP